MPWAAAAAVTASSLLGADSANKAADAQTNSANQALALQREQYNTARQDSAPYRQTGAEALNRIRQLYGMAPLSATQVVPQDQTSFDGRAYLNANPDVAASGMDPWQHWQTYGSHENRQFSYTPAAAAAMQANTPSSTGTPANTGTGGQSLLEMDPGYAFRLAEGSKALERSQAARGGLLSGAAAKEMAGYSQGLASQEFGNAYNRMASLAGIGQSQVNSDNSLGANYAGNAGNTITGAGNARASGYVGSTNALTSGVQTGLNYYQGNRMLAALNGNRNSGSSGDPLQQWGVYG